MNFLIFIYLILIYLLFEFVYGQLDPILNEEEILFKAYTIKFIKNYSNEPEYRSRFQNFKDTLKRIKVLNAHRKRNTDALYGLNEYSDLTLEEFKKKMINNQLRSKSTLSKKTNSLDEQIIDWTNRLSSLTVSEVRNNSSTHQAPNLTTRAISTDQINNSNDSLNDMIQPNSSIKSNLSKLDRFIENYISLYQEFESNLSKIELDEFVELITTKPIEAINQSLNVDKNNSIRTKRSLTRVYWNSYDEMLPASYPRKKDWRTENIISEVDNQNVCGACWAYTTLETIESMAAIKYGWPVDKRLSVQQLIDCSTNNYGCLGGDTCAVLSWIAENKIKLLSARAYPTSQSAGECRVKNNQIASGLTVLRNFTCTDYRNNEIELIKILAYHGPVATTADANLWQDYLGGIIQFNCGQESNHAVQIVGYNLETNIPYYIVRNTWGTNFGINGYLHVAIGGNLCALEERVSSLDVELI